MKYVVLASVVLNLALGTFLYLNKKEFNKRKLDMLQTSSEFGCYFESKNLCSQVEDDINRGHCYEDALDKCPKMAEQFRKWVEQGGVK